MLFARAMDTFSRSPDGFVWPGGLAQAALDRCDEAILLAEAEGNLLYANSAACSLLGYRGRELRERRLEEVLPEFRRLLQKSGVRMETEAQHREGKRLPVEVVFGQQKIDGRRFRFAFLHDIGKRKWLQDQLRESRRIAAVGRLVANVSHDFNNLLTAILIYSGLLLDNLPAESPLHIQAAQINTAAERGQALVAQLTALSGRRAFEPALLGLNEIVESVRDMLTRLLGENISLETSYGDRLRAIRADRTQLERMLVNLAVNARDAMPGGGVLRIATSNFIQRKDAALTGIPPGEYVRLTVADTGCGMDEDTRAHALEPFFTTKAPGLGTGLGLSTVYEIVRQNHGHLMLESAPRRGTQVQVFLPACDGEPALTRTPRKEKPASGAGTLLVVEDDDLVRRSLHETLSGKGYRVLQARNAREAMLIARRYRGPIDLMLSDLVLPGIGGPELADELRSLQPEMRVLYISGYRNDVRVRRLEKAGKPFFFKPFTAAAIAQKVSEILLAPNGAGEGAVTPVTPQMAKGH